MVQAPQSQMAEAIRELRTSLRVILDDAPCPLIIITSPEPGDGKTFVDRQPGCGLGHEREQGHRGLGRLPAAPPRGDLRAAAGRAAPASPI